MALYNIKAIAVITDTDETALVQLDELAGAINQYQVDNQYTTPFRFIKEAESGKVTFVNYKEKFSFKGIPVGLIGFDAAGGLVTYPLESKSSTQQSQLTSATFVFDGQPLTIPIYNSNGDGLENSAIHANTSGNYGIDVEDPQYKWDVRNGSINITQNTIDDGYRLNGHLFATINSADQKIEIGSRTGSPYDLSLIKSGTEVGLINEDGLDLHDYLLTTGAIQFDLETSQTVGEGKLQWNATDRTLEFGMGGDVTQQIGQELPIPVKHADNSGLENGKVVYIVGSDGTNKTVRYAQANSHTTSDTTLGVMTETVTGGEKGLCTTFGLVRDINTSALTEGGVIYLSDSVAGGMTSTKPTSPNHAVTIGRCIRSHATVGSIWVTIDTGNHLAELHDVYISSVANNDILKYVSANSRWENVSLNSTAWLLNAANTLSAKNYIGSASGNYDIGFKRNNTEVATLVSTGISLPLVSAATTDTDRFLVSDSGTIKYRTGVEVLSDIGGQATGTTWLLNAGNTLTAKDYIGSSSGAYDIGVKRNNTEVVTFVSGGIALPTIAAASTDTDMFIVSDSGTLKYRTGTQVLSDIGGFASPSGLTTNYVTKWNGTSLANSQIFDNGTNVGYGTTSPTTLLDVRGQISASLGSASAPAYSFVGDLNTGVFSPGADTLAVATGGVERIRVGSTGNLGIGVAVGAATSFRISKAITGGIISYGTYQDGVISSDVTSAAMYNKTIAATQAASFTLGDLRHFSAGQGTIGAGSSVTVQTAFYAESSLTGAFINYGYRGAIASGSNRWNLYMDGTAQNYIRGNVGIGASATTPSEQLYVNGTGRFTGAVQFDTVPSSLQDATSANHLVRYSQWIASTSIKYLPTAVKTVSLTNITLSGTQTVNGVALIAGDRILVAGQTTGSQNGVYVVAAGSWTRATDSDTDAEIRGFIVNISDGTYAGYKYINTNQSAITVGTTAVTYVEFSNISEIDPVFVAWRDTTRSANQVYAGPTSGSAAAATFRALVSDDIPNLAWSKITSGTPTTLAGYGITDAYTDTEVDTLLTGYSLTSHTHAFSDITSKPTTISGYGITDAYTDVEVDTLLSGYSLTSHTHTTSDITNLSSYTGLDARYYTESEIDAKLTPITSLSLTTNYLTKWNGTKFVNSLVYESSTSVKIGTSTYGDGRFVVTSASDPSLSVYGTNSQFSAYNGGRQLSVALNSSGNAWIQTSWPFSGIYSGALYLQPGGGNVGFGHQNAAERVDVNGNIKYSGLLKPSGTAGTNGQVLSTDGTNDVWATLTTSYISNLSSYTGFDARYYTETEVDTILSDYSLTSHTHTTSDITNLSSYTGLDVRYYTETEIDSKFATITSSSLTANTILHANGSKQIASLATATYPNLTELSYIKGITSSVQTQFGAITTILNSSALANKYHTRWDGSKFVNSLIYDESTSVRIGSSTYGGGRFIVTSNSSPTLSAYGNDVQFAAYNGGRQLSMALDSSGNAWIQTSWPFVGTYSGSLYLQPGGGNIGFGHQNAAERVDVNGNIKYSGLLKPSGVAGTNKQVLSTDGTNDEFITLDQTYISDFSDHTHTLSQLTDLPQGIDQVDDEDMVGLWVNDVRGEIGFVGKANSAAGGMIMYNKYSNAYTWIDDDGNVNLKGTQGYLNSKRILTTDDLGGTGGGGLYGLDDVLQYDPIVYGRGAVYRSDNYFDIIQLKAGSSNDLYGGLSFLPSGFGSGFNTSRRWSLLNYEAETEISMLASGRVQIGNYASSDYVYFIDGDAYIPNLANSSYLAVDSSGKLVPTTGGGGVDQGLDSVLSVDNTALNKSINLDATTGATNIRMKQSGTLKAGINYDTAGIFSIYTQPTVDFNIIADDVLNLISSTQVNISGPSVRIKIGAITYLLSVDGSGFLKGTIV